MSPSGSAAASAPAPATAPLLPASSGKDLARRVRANLDLPYEKLTFELELSDNRGATERRDVVFHLATALGGNDCAYTVFTRPAEIDGFGLMTVRPKGADPEQYLYVPAARKVSRVLYFSTNRRSSFCGTQLTFEDLEPLRLDDYDFDVGPPAVVEGRACYELRSRPRSKFSGYSRIRSWIDAERAVSLKTEFYDPKGDLLKTGSAADAFEAAPGHWRTRRTEMTNRQTERTTRMRLIGYECETKQATAAQAKVFTLGVLSQGHER